MQCSLETRFLSAQYNTSHPSLIYKDTHIDTHTHTHIYIYNYNIYLGFPGNSDGKGSACKARNAGSISGLGRSPGEGNGNPLQYSCLRNPMDRGAWWVIVHVC